MTVFNLEVPALLDTLTVVLMPIAYGAAFITATVVRYVIIPEEIAQQRPFGTFFKNYELVMHNYTAIFLAVDLWLVQAHLNWEFGIFPCALASSTCCFPTLMHLAAAGVLHLLVS